MAQEDRGASHRLLILCSQAAPPPCTPPSPLPMQAVARVHRIGQTRDTVVTRLLVDGTVEVEVLKVGEAGGGLGGGRGQREDRSGRCLDL